ncbi:MAG: methyltransferase [Bacteroidetes bacterium CG02_land_8_20_14_3_00_31_25]|nr:O-methyltransferase [Bacteroidota bacterium]PIV58732.1 MAG: methyltransferase [Bacteroidetes bacterium CG02_land_8_20_14_3_00_31_25]PIX35540.1 MAG: methyltransferase [Bacteroidetes bacterium CG_4_8_14_3_um_filter_31_14]PIY07416.1 MAG: methyltransferase [Bacteroidetes bacterium CG_4_10_14_3_um_filter_31_20]
MNINYELEQYILEHSEQESDLLKELNRETNVHIYHPRMLSGHLQGSILKMLTCMLKPQNILEIGTYTGYSALCFAEGLSPEGKIHTIEINDELEDFIKQYVNKSENKDKIILHFGDALKIIPTLNLKFDLVFIDADKKQYIEYYKIVFDKVKEGGYIIADNVLWSGKVTENYNDTDEQTRGIIDFNNFVQNDKRVFNVIFPIRDGLMVIKKF